MTRFMEQKQMAEEMKLAEAALIFQQLEDLDGKENEEALLALQVKIEEVRVPEAMKKVLKSRHRVLTKRLKTRVPDLFGEHVKRLREKLKLSINKVCEKTDGLISVSFWSRIEKGERKNLSTATLQTIATALHVNVAELLDIATRQEAKQQAVSLESFLIENKITIEEQEASMAQRRSLLQLLDTIHNAAWNSKTKYVDAVAILQAVDEYKSQLQKEVTYNEAI